MVQRFPAAREIDMTAIRTIPIERLDDTAFLPFGRVLGSAYPTDASATAYRDPRSDFWHVHDFDPGVGGQTEVLWVNYRNASLRITALEAHWLTEQAVVPLGSGLVHVVCASLEDGSRRPDLQRMRAFHIDVGQGVCMRPGCWHTSFVRGGETTCMMLTRRSTTKELVAHLAAETVAVETSIMELTSLEAVALARPG